MIEPEIDLLKRKCDELINEMQQLSTTTDDAQAFLEIVVELVAGKFSLPLVGLWGVDKSEQLIRFQAGSGAAGKILVERQLFQAKMNSKSWAARVVSENCVVIDRWFTDGGYYVTSLPSKLYDASTLMPEFVDVAVHPAPLLAYGNS